jgi:hypothetical protein
MANMIHLSSHPLAGEKHVLKGISRPAHDKQTFFCDTIPVLADDCCKGRALSKPDILSTLFSRDRNPNPCVCLTQDPQPSNGLNAYHWKFSEVCRGFEAEALWARGRGPESP